MESDGRHAVHVMGELIELSGSTDEPRVVVRVAIKRLAAAINTPGPAIDVVVLRRDLELVLAAIAHRGDWKPAAPDLHPEQR